MKSLLILRFSYAISTYRCAAPSALQCTSFLRVRVQHFLILGWPSSSCQIKREPPKWSEGPEEENVPISVKTDVYSFGVVLLEIVCCRRNIETEVPDNEIVLSDWVYNCFVSGHLQRGRSGALDRTVKVRTRCIREEPALRPSMKIVILMMEGNLDVPIPPCPTSTSPNS